MRYAHYQMSSTFTVSRSLIYKVLHVWFAAAAGSVCVNIISCCRRAGVSLRYRMRFGLSARTTPLYTFFTPSSGSSKILA